VKKAEQAGVFHRKIKRGSPVQEKVIECNTKTHEFRRLQHVEEIHQARLDPDALIWLDLIDPTEEKLAKVQEVFKLHPLAVEDATHEHQRPKVEQYDNFYFVVFDAVHYRSTDRSIEAAEIDMFLGQNYLITVHEEEIPELAEVEQRWTRNVKQLDWGIGVLLYTLLDTIVDNYFPIVDALVEQAEDLEDLLFEGHSRDAQISLQIVRLKKQFTKLRRITTPQRNVLNTLTNRDSPLFHENVQIYFRDIYDHITRLSDTIDIYSDQLSSTMDANLSIISNDLNAVMRTLTVASIILMANSLVAGIYGMNFDNIPELHLYWGYFACLGVMVLITAVLVFFFKIRKWL
jgi:magnesium transporter